MYLCCCQGSFRNPDPHKDSISTADKPRHIVVLCKSQFYTFDILHADQSPALTAAETAGILEAIVDDARSTPALQSAAQAVAVLTTEDRPIWAKLRDQLKAKSAQNATMLKCIDDALFILCLDDVSPANITEASALHTLF